MGSINTKGQVLGLTIKDMVRQVALNLRASSKVIENGYEVEVRDYGEGTFTRITIERAKVVANATNLSVANGSIKDMKIRSGINFANLLHLYVTWDLPQVATFCFASEGRFTLINVNHDHGAFIMSSVDQRRDEKPEAELSADQIEARSRRRTFYHIGSLFDGAKKERLADHEIEDEEESKDKTNDDAKSTEELDEKPKKEVDLDEDIGSDDLADVFD